MGINKIYVDAKRIIGEIEQTIYGFQVEHGYWPHTHVYGAIFDEGSNLSNELGLREDVIEACKRIKPTIRWPGGNFATAYHWRDGVGPRDERPTVIDFAFRQPESNRFGTDEFIEFCTLSDSTPFITVNTGCGTPEEAAQWVEYCNRKTDTKYAKLREQYGHPEPYGVKYWAIGNEMWGEFQTGFRGWDTMTADTYPMGAQIYARAARDFAKLMRRIDPAILITCVGTNIGTNPDWDLTVLKNVGYISGYGNDRHQYINTLHTHSYYSRYHSGDFDEDYYRIFAIPEHSEKNLKLKKSTIDVALLKITTSYQGGFRLTPEGLQANPPAPEKIGVSYDEWFVAGSHTLRDALGQAKMLNVFQRTSDFVKIACHFPLIHAYSEAQRTHYSAPLTVYKDTLILEAGYYVFDLYVNHTGKVAVDSYIESESYDIEFLPSAVPPWYTHEQKLSFKDVPYLDSSATMSNDRKTLYIATINAHRDEDMDCLIELRGCSPQETSKVFELNAKRVEAYNNRENRDNVKITEKPMIKINQNFTYPFPAHSVTVMEIPLA